MLTLRPDLQTLLADMLTQLQFVPKHSSVFQSRGSRDGEWGTGTNGDKENLLGIILLEVSNELLANGSGKPVIKNPT